MSDLIKFFKMLGSFTISIKIRYALEMILKIIENTC